MSGSHRRQATTIGAAALIANLVVSTLAGVVVLGSMLFLPAWTLNYWQAWVVLFLVCALSTWIPSIYWMRKDPEVLARRMRSGPVAEGRAAQKVAMSGFWLALGALFALSAFDYRFGWSHVPTIICLAGDALVAAGLAIAFLVVIRNSYAAATVQVIEDQKVVSSGVYGLVRHPMYTGILITLVGVPLALGSYWGLVFVLAGPVVLGIRIRDEEKLLKEELTGYREYSQKVRYRLLPGMW